MRLRWREVFDSLAHVSVERRWYGQGRRFQSAIVISRSPKEVKHKISMLYNETQCSVNDPERASATHVPNERITTGLMIHPSYFDFFSASARLSSFVAKLVLGARIKKLYQICLVGLVQVRTWPRAAGDAKKYLFKGYGNVTLFFFFIIFSLLYFILHVNILICQQTMMGGRYAEG